MARRSGHCGRRRKECSGLFETRAIQVLPSDGVRAEQCQIEPWPGFERDVSRIFLAPAKLETVAGFLDRNRIPPGPPLAVIFGQHDMIDIDLIPILGEGLVIDDGMGRGRFVVFCLARGLCGASFSHGRVGIEQAKPKPMAHNSAFPRVVPPAQRQHIAVYACYDCLVPALPTILICDDEVADADLLPIPRQTRRDPPGADPDAPDDPSDEFGECAAPLAAAASSWS